MNLYTGYYGKSKVYLNHGLSLCAISGKPPEGWNYYWYKKLAPSWSIWKQYDTGKNIQLYTDRFYSEILGKLDPKQVYDDLQKFGSNLILLCYEKPSDFCHRHLVADWLNINLNLNITEWNQSTKYGF